MLEQSLARSWFNMVTDLELIERGAEHLKSSINSIESMQKQIDFLNEMVKVLSERISKLEFKDMMR